MARSSKVLPAPDGPLTAIHSPADRVNEARLRTVVRRSRTRSTAGINGSRSFLRAVTAGQRQLCYCCRHLVGNREAGTDIDLAQHIDVQACRIPRAVEEISIPDD